jgi:hypothetical protein
MTEITHLVTNGCSFTYCQGLEKPSEQGWPALVAKQLGVPIVNLALMGCGNDSIHRRTYEYVYENLPTGSKPLVIIGWSQYWRQEQWYNIYPGHKMAFTLNDYKLISMPGSSPNGSEEKNLLDHWNHENFYRRTMIYKLSLANLFKTFNIPYIMSDYSGDFRYEGFDEARKKLPTMIQEANSVDGCTNRNFVEVTYDCPKLPCGHDGLEAQTVLSDYIMTEVDRLYGEIKVLPTDSYRTTKDTFNVSHHSIRDINHDWV